MADKVKFRYRGYYYDDETGFYYLQSRYYDPSLCRFISADQYELVGMLSQTLGQMNLYAYCNNNPIMYTDESGEGIITALIIGLIIGGMVVGGVYGGLNSSNTGWGLVGDIALGGLKGGLTAAVLALSLYGGGSLIGYGAGLIGSAFALAGSGMIGSGAAVGVAAVAAGVGVMVSGGVIANQLGILFSKPSKKSGKEMASDKPSWVNKDMFDPNLSAEKNVTDLLNEVRGPGKWKKRPGSEFNKIVKWLKRSLGYK